MIRWFGRLLFESTRAEFHSAYGLAESVERLRAATKRSVFFALGETSAVGKVSEEVVRLQRVIPMMGNSFKPFFTGRFEVRDGAVVLTGQFGMLTAVKVFMTFWFGMTSLFAAAALLGKFKPQGPNPTFFVVQPFLMIAFGVALVAAGKWLARNDIAWLSGLIARTLGAPALGATQKPGAIVDPDAVPMTLKVVAIVLAGSGVMPLLTGLSGGKLFPGLTTSPESNGLPLAQWIYLYAVAMILLSVGVWRRRPWAWWGGFVVLGLSLLFSLVVPLLDSRMGAPPFMWVVFGVFSCLVVAVWGRWWYAQRKYFLWS
jgi:hypothetical protein